MNMTTTDSDNAEEAEGELEETEEELHSFKMLIPKPLYLDIIENSAKSGVDHQDLFAHLISEGWRARCEGFSRPIRKIQHGVKVRIVLERATRTMSDLASVVMPEVPMAGECVSLQDKNYLVDRRAWWFSKDMIPEAIVVVKEY